MTPRITGNLLRAGRALTGLTREELAERAGLSLAVLYCWETSSDSIVPAQYPKLCKVVQALEREGVRFSEDGVRLERSAPTISATVISEGAVA